MSTPKPIVLTQADTNPSTSGAPQQMVVVGGVPVTSAELIASLKGLTGYSARATQSLENVKGTLTWVTAP